MSPAGCGHAVRLVVLSLVEPTEPPSTVGDHVGGASLRELQVTETEMQQGASELFTMLSVRKGCDVTARVSWLTFCRHNRKCDYSLSKQLCAASHVIEALQVDKGWPPGPQLLDINRMLFLDSRIADIGKSSAPGTTPIYILEQLGSVSDIRLLAAEFFESGSYWTPIISKRRFYDYQLQSLPPSPELALLLLTMRLIMTMPEDNINTPLTLTYYTAKELFVELDATGVLSIQVLQALVLLSLYEIGHAIFPAAFSTIAVCAKYADILGINDNGNLRFRVTGLVTLIEQEEARRVWWAIMIMDRYVSSVP